MSHEINSTDNFGYVGEAAWHGLGQKLDKGITTKEAFKQLELDWESELVPMHTVRATSEGMEEVEVEGRRLQVRTDTWGQLGIVSPNYHIFQNKDLADFTDTVIEASDNASLETCSTLFDGRQVYTLIAFAEEREVGPGDPVKPYVLINNTHGGKGSFKAFPTSVRVVCANTLRWAHSRDGAQSISYAHTGRKWDQRLEEAAAMLKRAEVAMEAHFTEAISLYEAKFNGKKLNNYFGKVWDNVFGARYPDKDKRTETKERMTGEWKDMLDHHTNTLPAMKGTMWQAYNAVSVWSDHERGSYGAVTEDRRRRDNNLFGAGHKLKDRAYAMAVASL